MKLRAFSSLKRQGKMKKLILIALAFVTAFALSGCAGLWEAVSIGKMKGKAEEDGFNYEDTGVVADPYFLYVNRKSINQSAIYPNAACRDGNQERILINNSWSE